MIPLGQKDYWNRSDPADDSQFEHRYTTPEVSRLENLLYGTPPRGHAGGALQPIDETGRTDLDAILLTGVPGLNFTGDTKADLLRLNTAIKPGAQRRVPGRHGQPGAARQARRARTRDLCGYPNGRRLGDDVIDIDLRAFAQGYGTFLNAAFGLPNKTPNNLARRRRGRERRVFLQHVPVRRVAASGLRGALTSSTRFTRRWRGLASRQAPPPRLKESK